MNPSQPISRKPKEGPAARQTERAMAKAAAKVAAKKAANRERSKNSGGSRSNRPELADNCDAPEPSLPRQARSGRGERDDREEKPRAQPKPRDGSELSALSPEDAYKAIFTHAGRLLAIKDWSRDGLAQRLAERFKLAPGSHAMAAKAADRMREIGALDDARFARGFIRARLGKRSVEQAVRELSAHGVSASDAQIAVEELRQEGLIAEPADQAYELWSKKFDSLPADERERGKQSRYMASRGFSYDALNRIWSRLKREEKDR